MRVYILFIQFLFSLPALGQVGNFTLSGQVSDATSGEDLVNATIYIEELKTGTTTNAYGFYSLTLPQGAYRVRFEYLGYGTKEIKINAAEDVVVNAELVTESETLDELVLSVETKNRPIEDVGMSKVSIDVETIREMPALLGEVDILKSIQLLPGVSSVGEGSSGFYVRGGNVDQNLILLDEAPVYNASHLLGFFSVFNTDAVRDVQFYKGAIPANYGGRLSSVVDIRMKEGNSKSFQGRAGLGLLSSRLMVEGPIGERTSFMLAGRRTYLDLFTGLASDPDTRNSKLYFYDANLKINHRINNKNRVFLSAYLGKDNIGIENDIESDYGNKTTTLRWNHIYSPRLFSNLTFYLSDYGYRLAQPQEVEAFEWKARLEDYGGKYDMGLYLTPSSTLKFGIHAIMHHINPGDIRGLNRSSIFNDVNIENTNGLELAAYAHHELEITKKLKVDYGLRFSSHRNLGAQTVINYDEEYNIIDSIRYERGEQFGAYYNLEPRIGIRYSINTSSALKASYNRTAQYIQLASNTTSETPLDIWFLSSPNVKPQIADQVGIGYFKNFRQQGVEASVELYYKKFVNAVDFKDHAQLLFNDQLERELRFGEGRSYGFEILVRKHIGKLSGWFGYTYSRTEKKINGINNNQWYNAKYDRTHSLSIVGSFDMNAKWTLSSTFIYNTGSAVTYPTGKYYQYHVPIPVYSERNAERLPAYHRLDFAAIWHMDKKLFGRVEQDLIFSIYNAYARKNTYAIAFRADETDSSKTLAEKTYLFSVIPSVTYNLKF